MGTIIHLVQGSPEWHAHRQKHRNASETAAVLGVSPWLTPYGLWLLKTGRSTQQVSAPMAHGSELEPRARAAYEKLTGHVMEPLVLVDGEYSASLDGITLDGGLICEIKVPFRGRESKLWQAAEGDDLPVQYRWQVQHQLMVSRAELAHVYVFDGQDGILLEQEPDPSAWPAITEAWDRFMVHVVQDRPPALTDGDTLAREDETWASAAQEYVRLKRAADEAGKLLEAAKERLVGLATHASETGAGVTVTKYWKQGGVDYKKVPALQDVDLEQYRCTGRFETRVSTQR